MAVSKESLRRAELSGDGWIEGIGGLWRKSFANAERLPECKIGNVVRTIVRDAATGIVIDDSAGSGRRRPRTLRKPKNVDVIAEINLADERDEQQVAWEDEELDNY